MDFLQFQQSIRENKLPANISIYLRALWYDARGDWTNAHKMVDELEDPDAYMVHAYLHRKEGDINNANYWYRKAGKVMPAAALEDEWEEVVKSLL